MSECEVTVRYHVLTPESDVHLDILVIRTCALYDGALWVKVFLNLFCGVSQKKLILMMNIETYKFDIRLLLLEI
jgi:hypothetical protein